MFDRFGKFNSVEELNLAAEGQKEEGDIESLIELAKENGIDPEDAQDYADGYADCLATVPMAITGRIAVETEGLKLGEILKDWTDYILSVGLEDEKVASGIMEKDLAGCIGAILKTAFNTRVKIPDKVVKAAGITDARVELGMPGSATVKKIIREYYQGARK